MSKMTGFIFQDEYLERLARLSDQELGRLVRALGAYHATGEQQELAGRESVAFDFIKADIDRINEKYESRSLTNRNNRQQNETNENETEQKQTKQNETAQVKDKVKDKVNNKSAKALSPSDRLFDKFWSVYPRHEGKQDAVKAFAKLKVDDAMLETMINAILKQKQSDQWSDPRFVPHPATWLNGHRWEDEPAKAGKGGKRVLAQQYEQREYNEEQMRDMLGVDDLFK